MFFNFHMEVLYGKGAKTHYGEEGLKRKLMSFIIH
jgi:hypothetical protein